MEKQEKAAEKYEQIRKKQVNITDVEKPVKTVKNRMNRRFAQVAEGLFLYAPVAIFRHKKVENRRETTAKALRFVTK